MLIELREGGIKTLSDIAFPTLMLYILSNYMKRLISFLGIILLSTFSCESETRLPIEEEKLVDILRDIHIAEAAMQNLIGVTKDSFGIIYYNQVLGLYGVERAVFDTTMERLRKDPERLSVVYEKVIKQLDLLEDSLTLKQQ